MVASVPAPSDAMVEQLRRMTAEPLTSATYSEADMLAAIARFPLADAAGLDPSSARWAGAWDLNRAAASIWEEKAAAYAADFDFNADGGDYRRSQVYAQMMAAASRYRSLRSSSSLVMKAVPAPKVDTSLPGGSGVYPAPWLGNAAEVRD